MKKSLWLTLAVAAVAALFVVAGCAPSPPPDPTPVVTPTPAPTPAVDECPTEWTTTIQQLYVDGEEELSFSLLIMFDKPIFIGNVAALNNPANWTIEVLRVVPYEWWNGNVNRWDSDTYRRTFDLDNGLEVKGVEFAMNNRAIVVDLWMPDNGPAHFEADDFFWGLICAQGDYDTWIADADGASNLDIRGVPTGYADEIEWSLADHVLLYDEFGNPCYELCGIGDWLCCAIEPCPVTPTPEPCPLP